MQKILFCIFKRYMALAGIILMLGVMLLPKAQACNIPEPCIDVTKSCEDASGPGEPIYFSITVSNCGCVELTNVTVIDFVTNETLVDGITLPCKDEPGSVVTYEGFSYIPTVSPSTNMVEASGTFVDTNEIVTARASATCQILDGNGGEGCTPGYWKNPKHFDDWVPTGYSIDSNFDAVFGTELFEPDITLLEAVNMGGGGVYKLARHGTAALLSAAHPDVDYPLTVENVMAAVTAGDADTLVEGNELGCPF